MKNIEIIETKDTFGNIRSYEVVEKMPEGYIVWNIGKNMGTDEYIPICARMSEDKHSDEYYHINPDTVRAIKLNPADVKVLREAAHHGIDNLRSAELVLRKIGQKMARRGNMTTRDYTKKAICEKALPIFEAIAE